MREHPRETRTTAIVSLIFLFVVVMGWGKNINKLTECDFEAPYEAEVAHSIGVVPIVGAVTGWMDFGK